MIPEKGKKYNINYYTGNHPEDFFKGIGIYTGMKEFGENIMTLYEFTLSDNEVGLFADEDIESEVNEK